MKADLPHLTALRAFHAVARSSGIAPAARSLNVTPGAIRHQIRQLEGDLGVQLVLRSRRGFALTPAGASYYDRLNRAFEDIQTASRNAANAKVEGELRVACAPALAALRLLRVVQQFSRKFPAITVRLFPIEQASEGMDVVISFGERPITGTRYAILRNEAYFAVCSPDLFYRGPLRSIEDLRHHALLHADDGEDWQRLLQASGCPGVSPRQDVFLPNAQLTLQAAKEGCGLAIGSSILCADDLRRGTLLRAFELEVPAPHPYFVIQPGDGNRVIADAFAGVLVDLLEKQPSSMLP